MVMVIARLLLGQKSAAVRASCRGKVTEIAQEADEAGRRDWIAIRPRTAGSGNQRTAQEGLMSDQLSPLAALRCFAVSEID
jgi:hypothetical protein